MLYCDFYWSVHGSLACLLVGWSMVSLSVVPTSVGLSVHKQIFLGRREHTRWGKWGTKGQREGETEGHSTREMVSSNKAVTRPIVAKSRKFGWILLNSLEFTWIRGFRETRVGWTDGQTDRRTKPLIELLFATKNNGLEINNRYYDQQEVGQINRYRFALAIRSMD